MVAAGVAAIGSDAEGRGLLAAMPARTLAPKPAVMHAKQFSARLSAAGVIGIQQRLEAAGVPAIRATGASFLQCAAHLLGFDVSLQSFSVPPQPVPDRVNLTAWLRMCPACMAAASGANGTAGTAAKAPLPSASLPMAGAPAASICCPVTPAADSLVRSALHA